MRTLGWTRFGQNVKPPDLGTNFGSEVLGLPGTNGPDPRESGLPYFTLGSDYSGLGNTEGWNPLFRNDQSYTFSTNASWMKGSHEIRFGFDFHAPPDEPLAAGTGRRPSRRIRFRQLDHVAEHLCHRVRGRIPRRHALLR